MFLPEVATRHGKRDTMPSVLPNETLTHETGMSEITHVTDIDSEMGEIK